LTRPSCPSTWQQQRKEKYGRIPTSFASVLGSEAADIHGYRLRRLLFLLYDLVLIVQLLLL
jgi:hypothetical protein